MNERWVLKEISIGLKATRRLVILQASHISINLKSVRYDFSIENRNKFMSFALCLRDWIQM